MKYAQAYEQVFGQVNGSTFSRRTDALKRPIREGKTARDKAKGHVPGQVNRRVWDERSHKWIKA